MTIRPIQIEDISGVVPIIELAFPKDIGRVLFDVLTGIIDLPAGEYQDCFQMVAQEPGHIIAFGGHYRLPSTLPGWCGVNWMAVHPNWRGHGTGRWLLRAIEESTRAKYEVIFVHATNSSVGFYEKQGYKKTEPCPIPEFKDTTFLTKRL